MKVMVRIAAIWPFVVDFLFYNDENHVMYILFM